MFKEKEHRYAVEVTWTGNTGAGTTGYRDFERSHDITIAGKPVIQGSADPTFRGDATKHNPEEFLVAALSECHMLSYLHLCATAGVVVRSYVDTATGIMVTGPDGGGEFRSVTLHPAITVTADTMIAKAEELHEKANALCFIARSVNFPVHHEPTINVEKPV